MLATNSGDAKTTDVAYELDQQKLKEKAVELHFAAKTVIQQLAMKDKTPEGLAAARILEDAMTSAIPNGPVINGNSGIPG